MNENKMMFYFSKWRLFVSIILLLLLIGFGAFLIWGAYTEESLFLIVLTVFFTMLFSFFCAANILKLFSGHPYIIITEQAIQLDPFTKSETTIVFEDIHSIKISEVSFQKMIELDLYNERNYFANLSFHNKVRLFMNRLTGFSLFIINLKVIRKRDHAALVEALDNSIQNGTHATDCIGTLEEYGEAKELLEKYDSPPPLDRSINRSYFLKSYGYGLFIFALLFVFFYLLMSKNDSYLFYIIINFLVFPFGKVLVDWLFGFKLRHKIDKQKGYTYYIDQLMFMFDCLLFHISLFLAPIGILFLLIRYITIRVKQ